MFGEAIENFTESEKVHKLFTALMLQPDEVVKNITYVFINGEERKMKGHDAVMPLGVKGDLWCSYNRASNWEYKVSTLFNR